MYVQSFTEKNLKKIFNKKYFKNSVLTEKQEEFSAQILEEALICLQSGFQTTDNPLTSFNLRGKKVFSFKKHCKAEELISLKIALNIKTLSKLKFANRIHIVSCLNLLLSEGVPYGVHRLDIRSFYESFEHSFIIQQIDKLKNLCPITKKLVFQLLECHIDLGGTGLPRGLAVSAVLSEYLMQEFDTNVKNLDEVFFYARYVDDIIIVTSGSENNQEFINKLQCKLPDGLSFHPEKKLQSKISEEVLATKKTQISLLDFEYLGYSFRVDEPLQKSRKRKEDHERKVTIDIAPKKIKKIKFKLSRAFWDFTKHKDWSLLEDRVKFLTNNFSIYNSVTRRKKMAGIYFTHPLISESKSSGLLELDRFLKNAILSTQGRLFSKTSRLLNKAQKRKLLSYTFTHGHHKKTIIYFSTKRINEIQKCWKY